jgi:DNA-binding NarL/FixJ family response regulator
MSTTEPNKLRAHIEPAFPLAGPSTADQLPRLIIADDDPVVRSMLSMALSNIFNIVGVAADGESAIELARLSQPDAAVVDVQMPGGGGMRAVRGIVAASPGTAIVMLSGDESDTDVRELIQAGAVAYRRKGLAPPALGSCLLDSIKSHAEWRLGPA